MLEGFWKQLKIEVPPVPRFPEWREPPQATNNGEVPRVPSVPPQKTEIETKSKNGEDFVFDDRHHCRDCLFILNGYCRKQQFRPVDDIPRRCSDFRS